MEVENSAPFLFLCFQELKVLPPPRHSDSQKPIFIYFYPIFFKGVNFVHILEEYQMNLLGFRCFK